MKTIFLRSAIKVAPTELIGNLACCYKQFAPTELEKKFIHLPKSAYEINYSLYKQILYLKLKEDFIASIKFDTRGSWTVCNKAAPTELKKKFIQILNPISAI